MFDSNTGGVWSAGKEHGDAVLSCLKGHIVAFQNQQTSQSIQLLIHAYFLCEPWIKQKSDANVYEQLINLLKRSNAAKTIQSKNRVALEFLSVRILAMQDIKKSGILNAHRAPIIPGNASGSNIIN